MLALLFRHGVELPVPSPTNASLEVAGLWHRSHLRALREPLGSSCTCPGLARAQPAPSIPLFLVGLMGMGLSVQYEHSCLWDRRELMEPQRE